MQRLEAGQLGCPGTQPPAGPPNGMLPLANSQGTCDFAIPCPSAEPWALSHSWLVRDASVRLQRMCMQTHSPGPQPMDTTCTQPEVHGDLSTASAWCDTWNISQSLIRPIGRGCTWSRGGVSGKVNHACSMDSVCEGAISLKFPIILMKLEVNT